MHKFTFSLRFYEKPLNQSTINEMLLCFHESIMGAALAPSARNALITEFSKHLGRINEFDATPQHNITLTPPQENTLLSENKVREIVSEAADAALAYFKQNPILEGHSPAVYLALQEAKKRAFSKKRDKPAAPGI